VPEGYLRSYSVRGLGGENAGPQGKTRARFPRVGGAVMPSAGMGPLRLSGLAAEHPVYEANPPLPVRHGT